MFFEFCILWRPYKMHYSIFSFLVPSQFVKLYISIIFATYRDFRGDAHGFAARPALQLTWSIHNSRLGSVYLHGRFRQSTNLRCPANGAAAVRTKYAQTSMRVPAHALWRGAAARRSCRYNLVVFAHRTRNIHPWKVCVRSLIVYASRRFGWDVSGTCQDWYQLNSQAFIICQYTQFVL